MAIIEVENLGKSYGGAPAVDGISFTVQEGEIFGILGPNGAGKTTTVECLEGLRTPDSGRISILGHEPTDDFVRERIGVQLQESQLQGHLKVREALELYGSFYDDPRDPDELIEQWGLHDKRTAKFKSLSGGQKRRLVIALALVGRPRIAFLDELTTGLDPQARRATWKLVQEIRASGVTVVLVSHFMDEAQELCDRIAIFDRGRIAALNTPEGLIESVGGLHTMRFRIVTPFDVDSLRSVPGVTGTERSGDRVTITGAGDFATEVTAALAGRRILVADLRIDSRTLDDAYVALTGTELEN
ncbi:MAG TPA: ABC transporter ATP-binding protein [Mycobacteriales bacterium]|nr:ABC transporter ATP-binding protein [Mycobacteriales bacterium]